MQRTHTICIVVLHVLTLTIFASSFFIARVRGIRTGGYICTRVKSILIHESMPIGIPIDGAYFHICIAICGTLNSTSDSTYFYTDPARAGKIDNTGYWVQ